MSKSRGKFTEYVIVYPPVIGLDTDGPEVATPTSTRGKFRCNTIVLPPVIGMEYLNLRLRVQVSPTGDASALEIHRVIERASAIDRTLGGKGLTELSQQADGKTVVLLLGSVDPIGGDERIARIVAAMNQRDATNDIPLVIAEPA